MKFESTFLSSKEIKVDQKIRQSRFSIIITPKKQKNLSQIKKLDENDEGPMILY